jgi:hypothetical protein
MSRSMLLLACPLAVFLAACGSRSEAPAPPRAAPAAAMVAASQTPGGDPTSRSVSASASSDDEEPVDVSMLKLPQPEHTEPETVK